MGDATKEIRNYMANCPDLAMLVLGAAATGAPGPLITHCSATRKSGVSDKTFWSTQHRRIKTIELALTATSCPASPVITMKPSSSNEESPLTTTGSGQPATRSSTKKSGASSIASMCSQTLRSL
jgi:hypothetical protein